MQKSTLTSLTSTFESQRHEYEGVESQLYRTSTFSPGSGRDAAFDYIKENKDKYNKIMLVGHSTGTDAAVELSHMLGEENINVDTLITIDLQSVFWDTTDVPSNVKNAKNYYQTNWGDYNIENIINPNGALLTSSNSTSNVSNIDASTYCGVEICSKNMNDFKLFHTSIDNILGLKISNDIDSNIQ